jgi:hypothetical protein
MKRFLHWLRDQRTLEWTLESLTDNVELLPFVEAIPDMIHGSNRFRRINDPLFKRILGTTDVASPLVTKLAMLLFLCMIHMIGHIAASFSWRNLSRMDWGTPFAPQNPCSNQFGPTTQFFPKLKGIPRNK